MSHDYTLPGDVPGLLRRGSPCLWTTGDGMGGVAGDPVICMDARTRPDLLALDLTDPTGRIHALWWWMQYAGADFRASSASAALPRGASWAHIEARVLRGDDLAPDDLDTFARVMRAAVEVVRG